MREYEIKATVEYNDIPFTVRGKVIEDKATRWEPSHIDIENLEISLEDYVVDDIIRDDIYEKIYSLTLDKVMLMDVIYMD